MKEKDMSGQSTVSVVHRQFGAEIKTLRERMKLSAERVARVLRNTDATVRRWERGVSRPRFGELQQMFDLYHVDEAEHRIVLQELHEQNDREVWHSRLKLPEVTSGMHGFEAAATAIDLCDLSVIPGPLQTEAYADAVLRALHPELTEEDRRRLVELRIRRQQRAYKVDRPPTVRAVLAEEALAPFTDDTQAMRDQLRYLYGGPFGSKLRILPAGNRLHEGMNGSFSIYRYDTTNPGVYSEGSVRNIYTEAHDTVTQAQSTFERLWNTALTEQESSKLILSAMKGL